MAEEKFIFDSLQDSNTIKEFLQSLTEGFEKGSITLSSNKDEIVLEPHGLLNFTVKAKRKGASNKLNISIAWKEIQAAPTPEEGSLKVS